MGSDEHPARVLSAKLDNLGHVLSWVHEEQFRLQYGDELTEKILRFTSQIYDYPFWKRVQDACYSSPEIAYEMALYEWGQRN